MEGAERVPAADVSAARSFPGSLRVAITDDLRRSRLTVFFRLLLALPLLIWLLVWGLFMLLVAIANWFAVVVTGRSVATRLIQRYLRFLTHFQAYLYLGANPFPDLSGEPGYPIDLEIPEPARQSRWSAAFRLILGIPAALLAAAFASFAATYTSSDSQTAASFTVGILGAVGFLGWWVSLFTGRMAEGLRDLLAYGIGYVAQAHSYFLLYTDRYPSADPLAIDYPGAIPEHPVRLSVSDDLRRSRLTVFFRLLLAIPHFFWLFLWGIVVFFAVVANWFATLFAGRSPGALHRFIGSYVRYAMHVMAFVYLVANPFPGFAGAQGRYPVDLQIGESVSQNRWKTFFRLFLAVPAWLLTGALGNALLLVAVFGWFTGLFLGRMPEGLRNLGAFALRYNAQTLSYLALLTDSYPYASPRLEQGGVSAPPPVATRTA